MENSHARVTVPRLLHASRRTLNLTVRFVAELVTVLYIILGIHNFARHTEMLARYFGNDCDRLNQPAAFEFVRMASKQPQQFLKDYEPNYGGDKFLNQNRCLPAVRPATIFVMYALKPASSIGLRTPS